MATRVFYADFWCPSCKKWMQRDCKPRQRVLWQRCENAGRVVKMKRRAAQRRGCE